MLASRAASGLAGRRFGSLGAAAVDFSPAPELQPSCCFSYTPRGRNGDDVTDTSLCCAPIINLWGAYWPAWVLCLVSSIVLTLVSRLILSRTRLEPHLGPLLLVYPMLIVAYACGLWLLLYRA